MCAAQLPTSGPRLRARQPQHLLNSAAVHAIQNPSLCTTWQRRLGVRKLLMRPPMRWALLSIENSIKVQSEARGEPAAAQGVLLAFAGAQQPT